MNESLPHYPERLPDVALFSLRELYEAQPEHVLAQHARILMALEVVSKHEIAWGNLELQTRNHSIREIPKGFDRHHELVKHLTNEAVEEHINDNRDRMLTILSHKAVISTINSTPVRRGSIF